MVCRVAAHGDQPLCNAVAHYENGQLANRILLEVLHDKAPCNWEQYVDSIVMIEERLSDRLDLRGEQSGVRRVALTSCPCRRPSRSYSRCHPQPGQDGE